MHKYSEVKIKKMLEFLIDNIFVVVDGWASNIPLEFPWIWIVLLLLVDSILHYYKVEFIQTFLHENKNPLLWLLVRNFNLSTTSYVDSTTTQRVPSALYFDILWKLL
jgi:hypothetical protein